MIEIRPEKPGDLDSIRSVTTDAFRGRPYADGDEQDVIERLRAANSLTLSLVAIDGGQLVGQITFSPAVNGDGSGPWLALGPVSVEPERQGEGIGELLINTGVEEFVEQGALGIILTGNPDYYTRFGFEVSPDLAPENEPGEFFMLRLLHGDRPTGVFSFHPAFYGS